MTYSKKFNIILLLVLILSLSLNLVFVFTLVKGESPPLIPASHGVFIELEGSGQFVSENFEAPQCTKSIWKTSIVSEKENELITVNLFNTDCEASDPTCGTQVGFLYEGLEGEQIQRMRGGSYFIAVDSAPAPPATWKVTGECRD